MPATGGRAPTNGIWVCAPARQRLEGIKMSGIYVERLQNPERRREAVVDGDKVTLLAHDGVVCVDRTGSRKTAKRIAREWVK